MKKLLITLLLISPFSFADWGDVYYCQSITDELIKDDGNTYMGESIRFKFSMDQQSQSMVFGALPLIWGKQMFPVASFEQSADGMLFETIPRKGSYTKRSTFNYNKGKLFGVAWFGDGLNIMVADCDKF
jgi:hypothetical protein